MCPTESAADAPAGGVGLGCDWLLRPSRRFCRRQRRARTATPSRLLRPSRRSLPRACPPSLLSTSLPPPPPFPPSIPPWRPSSSLSPSPSPLDAGDRGPCLPAGDSGTQGEAATLSLPPSSLPPSSFPPPGLPSLRAGQCGHRPGQRWRRWGRLHCQVEESAAEAAPGRGAAAMSVAAAASPPPILPPPQSRGGGGAAGRRMSRRMTGWRLASGQPPPPLHETGHHKNSGACRGVLAVVNTNNKRMASAQKGLRRRSGAARKGSAVSARHGAARRVARKARCGGGAPQRTRGCRVDRRPSLPLYCGWSAADPLAPGVVAALGQNRSPSQAAGASSERADGSIFVNPPVSP